MASSKKGEGKAPEPRKVRTTFHPDREIEVSPEEYIDLARQDLLVGVDPAEAEAVVETLNPQTTKGVE